MANLPLRRLCAILDLGQQLGLNPYAAISNLLGVGSPAFMPGFSFECQLVDGNKNDSGSHYAECTRRAHRHIYNPASHEWTAIIDPALDRVSGVRHRDDTPEGPGSVGARHFARVTSPTVIGGEAGLGFTCSSR
jgi:hypothetical protein